MSLDAVDALRHGERSDEFEMEYFAVQPNKWTFQSTKIREWCERNLKGRVLNICCGPTELEHAAEIVRNDINEDIDADYHYDARSISEHFGPEFDTVAFDPPFTAFQATTHYNGNETGYDTAMKREIHRVLRPGGRVIQFGYTTTCMPKALDYKRVAVAVFNTLGRQNDILGVVDEQPGYETRRQVPRTEQTDLTDVHNTS